MIQAVGLDLVDLARIRTVLARHPRRFLERCFTDEEIRYCRGRTDPVPSLAARFAAKEAFQKCWPERLGWRDVSVTHEGPAPHLRFGPTVAGALASDGLRAHLSLSHARDHAAAVVVLERLPGGHEAP